MKSETNSSLCVSAAAQVWTGQGMKPKDANALPALVDKGQAQRIVFPNPISITGTVDFL